MNRITFLIFSTIAVICVFVSQPKSTQVECKNATESAVEQIIPIVVEDNIETTTNNTTTYYVTHYCSCYQCTGYEHSDYVFGAYGIELTPMVSVACNDFPCNTQLLITHEDGSQEVWIVQDRGVSGHLDLYVGNSHELALSIPNEYVTIEVFEPNHFDMEVW